MKITVRVQEFDTIIAALRLWQRSQAHIADTDGMIAAIAEEHGEAMTNEEIDAFIEKINTQPGFLQRAT
jgi:predicted nucleic acid-binding protein